MRKNAKGVGLAIIGAGRVGLFRGEVAARHPAVEWIGIAELNHNRGGDVAARIGADFVTTDYRALFGGLMARMYGLDQSGLQKVFATVQPRDLALV